MKIFIAVIAVIVCVLGFIGMILSAIFLRLWFLPTIILGTLKILVHFKILVSSAIMSMPYLAGPLTLSVIGTSIWFLVFGLIGLLISFFTAYISGVYLDQK